MKIIKYKYLGNSKYELVIDNEKEIIYEDLIVKYELLLKKEIDKKLLDKIKKENIYYEMYYKALKYLGIKMRTRLELLKYLSKDYNDTSIINKVLDKIDALGYLDQTSYVKAYINDAINMKNIGPLKIKKDLLGLGLDEDVINKEISIFNKDLIDSKIKKYIAKQVKMNKNKSLKVLKEKILNYLINIGYSREDILDNLSNINVDEEDIRESEYQKLYKKLSSKYQGKELEYKIKQKMYAKGFYNKND